MEFARPWQRFIASIIDTAVFAVFCYLLYLLIPNPTATEALGNLFKDFFTFNWSFSAFVDNITLMSNGRALLYFFIAFAFYLIIYVIVPCITDGKTLGKYIMRIRIVKLSEKRMSFGTLFLRQIVSVFLDFYSMGITLIISLFSIFYAKGNRIVHDRMTNTLVVKE